jgi:3D-(3,5/4)-trihydroxycyclohexane-1,2-dione acylhydrolase (decyclizing)
MTLRLTTAQAIIRFLKAQFVERDGSRNAFFAGCFGIFGHGNVAGIGQALQQNPDFPYYLCRNEQAMVHTAAAFAKMSNRLRTLVCTTSIGPGATNMVTGAAGATINRIPVLLLPGDIFARRNVAPVLQQLESTSTQDVSVNDCFQAGVAILGSYSAAGADSYGVAGSDAGADFSGGNGSGDAGAAAGRAGRGV